MPRLRQQVRRPARLDDSAAEQKRDAVADLRDDAEVVRDEQNRRPVRGLHRADQSQDLLLHGHVERRRRLVGDDQPRLQARTRSDQHALAHAAGKLMRIAAEHTLRLANMDFFEEGEPRSCRALRPVRAAAGGRRSVGPRSGDPD